MTKESPVVKKYEMKTFRLESAGGCQGTTAQCAYYELWYPTFSGLDSTVTKKIQHEMQATLALDDPQAEGKSIPRIAEAFIKSYEDFKREAPTDAGGWHFMGQVDVSLFLDTLISLSITMEYYTGGAHGGNGVYFINIHPETGKKITLENVLKPGYKEALTKAGEQAFRQIRELSDTASLKDNYFEFPNDKFQLNQNYGFKREGIVFYYNSYEIAPYAAGPTEVLIPYKQINNWIKSH